jgi:hypothetical protein
MTILKKHSGSLPRNLNLPYLTRIIKEKVLPLLWNEGVPIKEEELLDLFEDWFFRIRRFRVGSSTEMQHQKNQPVLHQNP